LTGLTHPKDLFLYVNSVVDTGKANLLFNISGLGWVGQCRVERRIVFLDFVPKKIVLEYSIENLQKIRTGTASPNPVPPHDSSAVCSPKRRHRNR